MGDNGKGDKDRTGDRKAFRSNFDRIDWTYARLRRGIVDKPVVRQDGPGHTTVELPR